MRDSRRDSSSKVKFTKVSESSRLSSLGMPLPPASMETAMLVNSFSKLLVSMAPDWLGLKGGGILRAYRASQSMVAKKG